MKRSEIKDRHGMEIWAGDTLRFVDKREWYRATHIGLSDEELDALPFEERTVRLPQDFAWLLSPEIQTYWQIVKRPKSEGK